MLAPFLLSSPSVNTRRATHLFFTDPQHNTRMWSNNNGSSHLLIIITDVGACFSITISFLVFYINFISINYIGRDVGIKPCHVCLILVQISCYMFIILIRSTAVLMWRDNDVYPLTFCRYLSCVWIQATFWSTLLLSNTSTRCSLHMQKQNPAILCLLPQINTCWLVSTNIILYFAYYNFPIPGVLLHSLACEHDANSL